MKLNFIHQIHINRIVRHLRHVPVLHVAAVAARRGEAPEARPGRGRAQRLRHVLDQLVHSRRRGWGVSQWRAGARLRVGLRGTPLRLHRRLRDLAQGRTGARRTVPFQTKCTHRIYGLQRRRSAETSIGVGKAVQR